MSVVDRARDCERGLVGSAHGDVGVDIPRPGGVGDWPVWVHTF